MPARTTASPIFAGSEKFKVKSEKSKVKRTVSTESSDPRACAERLLAVRDHGLEELRRKLLKRGYAPGDVERVLDDLAGRGILDDVRFIREFTRQALEKGHGPAYIRAKLASRGTRSAGPVCTHGEELASLKDFLERRRRRPGALTAAPERAKIQRFLLGRGYSAATINAVLGAGGDLEDM
jgi:regulatory protein